MSQAHYLWRVKYSRVFSSSYGMKSYTIHEDTEGYFTTNGGGPDSASLEHLQKAIQATLDNQTKLVSIIEATYLGTVWVQS